MSSSLVAVAEGRELEKLAAQLEAGGASVLRCPMLTMTDPEDGAPLTAFISAVIAGEIDDILFMTGEGVERLFAHAAREGHESALIEAMRPMLRIGRGSKAVRELKSRGLSPEFVAEPPTTEGVRAAWSANPPAGRRVGVVRSGDEIAGAEAWLAKIAASVHPVSSYTYGPASDSEAVADLLEKLSRGEVRVLALTSIAQARALITASERAGAPLSSRLAGTLVASIGPSLTAFLTEHGIRVALQPEDRHFLAPFAKTILAALKA